MADSATGKPAPTAQDAVSPGNFVVSARSVAVAASLAAIGSLATLSIIVSIKDVDILSTVALALAILAFVVQIIVYVVQSNAAGAQLADARSLHGEMMMVLAEVQERTVGTQQSIDIIRQQVIDDLRRKAAGSVEMQIESTAVDGTERPLLQNDPQTSTAVVYLGDELTESPALARGERNFPGPLPPSVAEAIQKELTTWPSPSDITDVASVLTKMSRRLAGQLRSMSADAKSFTRPHATMGPGISTDIEPVRKLMEMGFAEKVPGWKLATLTSKGRRYGRVFTAVGEPPAETPKELLELVAALKPPPPRNNRDED